MDRNEMYDPQAGTMEDSSERLEKKEQLRAKVQALVAYYEDEKRRNEELTMELERLKAEQQMQGINGPAPMAPPNGMGPPPGMQGMPGPRMPGAPGPGMGPANVPGAPAMAPNGGIPFNQRPQQPPSGMPGPEFPQPPQAPGGYTMQNFGMPQGPQGFPGGPQPRPQPYGAPPAFSMPAAPQMPPQFPPQGMFPPQGPGFGASQPYGPAPQPGFGQPGMYPQGMNAPTGYPQGDGLTENIGMVLQTITQVRSKLHQFESIRGYGYPQQPAYVDYDTVALLDKLYDQLGDLSRELMQRR